MNYRPLGNTDLMVSEIGFGCGNVGGVMIRGEKPERLHAIGSAMEVGINYFDTAPLYGNGVSEQNLGQALNELGAQAYVGTKVRLTVDQLGEIRNSVIASMDQSLARMGRESVDLLQLHNYITSTARAEPTSVSPQEVLEEVAGAFEQLKAQGKTRFYGITGVGDTPALHQVVQSGALNTVQTPYSLVNPSAGVTVPSGFLFPNFDHMIDQAVQHGMGVLAIRVLAGGALADSEQRHPLASSPPAPIGSGNSYQEDRERARALGFLVLEGHASSMAEAAVRFALAKAQVASVMVGFSSLEQIEQAVGYAQKGPLSPAALARLEQHWASA